MSSPAEPNQEAVEAIESLPPVPVPSQPIAVPPSREVVAHGLQMKRRHPWAVFALSYLTLGIYYCVWWFKIHNELDQFDPRQRIAPTTSLAAITVGALIIVPPWVSTATQGGRISRAQRAADRQASCSGGLGLVLCVLCLFNTVYYQSELNKIIDSYGVREGTRVPLYA